MAKPRLDPTVNWAEAWPIPEVTGAKLCPYVEPRPGARTLSDLLRAIFPEFKLRVAFTALVIQCGDMIDGADQGRLTAAELPSPIAHRQTKGMYGAEEVAAWWNAARQIVQNWRKKKGLVSAHDRVEQLRDLRRQVRDKRR